MKRGTFQPDPRSIGWSQAKSLLLAHAIWLLAHVIRLLARTTRVRPLR